MVFSYCEKAQCISAHVQQGKAFQIEQAKKEFGLACQTSS